MADSRSLRPLHRREALAVLAAAGVACVGRAAAAACPPRPRQTIGPYFVDTDLERPDLRTDPAGGAVSGAPLALTLVVAEVRSGGCAPLAGARVDVWHCDARGRYSDVADPWFDTRGRRFLRGWQRTDAAGTVRFTTIWPGWYPGRAVHVHFRVRTAGRDFASQLYFDDALTDRVHGEPPYAPRAGRRTRNGDDFLFRAGGAALVLPVVERGDGWAATFDVGLPAA